MTPALVVPLTAVLVAATPAHAIEVALPRITSIDARHAAHQVFDVYVRAAGDHLTIGPCRPAGRRSRACTVRAGADRWRFTAHYANAAREVIASQHRIPNACREYR